MGRSAAPNTVVIKEGLHIFMRRKTWWVYIKLDGQKKSVRKTLSTKEIGEARTRAWAEYDEARHRMKTGKPASKVSFSKLADDYVVSMGNRGSKTYHAETIKRHLEPFFSIHVPDFSNVTSSDLQDYLNWRRAKLTRLGRPPKDTTLNRESVVLRGLIKHAVSRGYISKDQAPEVPLLKTTTARRPDFSHDELEEFLTRANERISETQHPVTKRSRQLLYDWIVVLLNSGLRPEESLKLTWADVRLGKSERFIHVPQAKSKRRKARNVYPMPEALEQLKELKARQSKMLKEHGRKLTNDDPVFASWDGQIFSQVKSFKSGFGGLLDACLFSRKKADGDLSPESLRHTYATMRLQAGVNQDRLSDNMGTSAEMIQEHYGHVSLGDFEKELTKVHGEQTTQGKSSVPNDGTEKMDAVIAALNKDKAETVVDVVRQQVMKEWIAENGREPDPTAPGDEEIFEGHVYIRMRDLGHGDLYEPPDDLPDSLPD